MLLVEILPLRIRPHEAGEVSALVFVGVTNEDLEVAEAIVAGACLEEVSEGEGVRVLIDGARTSIKDTEI